VRDEVSDEFDPSVYDRWIELSKWNERLELISFLNFKRYSFLGDFLRVISVAYDCNSRLWGTFS